MFFDMGLRQIVHDGGVTVEFEGHYDSPYKALAFFINDFPDAIPDNFSGWVQVYDHAVGITSKIEFKKGR